MRTSLRRLLYTFCLAFALLCFGTVVETRAQGIPGVPGSAADAALGLGVSENKLGSVLFYNYYTSDALSSQVNTRISITNTNPTAGVSLHIFYVDSVTCNVADAFLCLTASQTYFFTASDMDPNVTGYLVVVAIDGDGRPMSFNYLAGDELVVAPTGHRFGLAAMAAARRDGNFVSPINSDGVTSTLFFNGLQYDYLPYAMLLDNFPSQVSGLGAPLADTRLYVYTPLSDLSVGDSSFSGSLFFLVFDERENGYSGSLPLGCFLTSDKQRVTSVRTAPPINTIVPAGQSGWMKFYATGRRTIVGDTSGCRVTLNNVPLMGATATTIRERGISGGHNLRYSTTFNAPGYSITLPVITPPCGLGSSLPTRGSSICGG